MKKYVILISIFNYWKSVFKVLQEIDLAISAWNAEVSILIVNDASTENKNSIKLNFKNIKSVLDVGVTEDNKFKSSNYLTKKFGFIKNIFGLSDQNVKNKFYRKIFKKSILKCII